MVVVNSKISDDTRVLVATSVEHPDMPPQKNTTRAHLFVFYNLLSYFYFLK
jgi:hypothetical protein